MATEGNLHAVVRPAQGDAAAPSLRSAPGLPCPFTTDAAPVPPGRLRRCPSHCAVPHI